MSAIDGKQVATHGCSPWCMGAVAALASIVLCLCVAAVYNLYLAHWWLIFLLPALGCLSLWLYHRAQLPLDMSTRHVVDSIRSDRPVSPLLAPGILVGTCLSILGGASVGKEAGALQMGASLGNVVGQSFKLKPVHAADKGEPMDGYAAATGHGRHLRGPVLRPSGFHDVRVGAFPLQALGGETRRVHTSGLLRGLRHCESGGHRRHHPHGGRAGAVLEAGGGVPHHRRAGSAGGRPVQQGSGRASAA